jgi:phosphatidylserine decarboxylase
MFLSSQFQDQQLTRLIGKEEGTTVSANQIASFVDFYHINMAEFTPSDIKAYRAFEDFFVRKHTPASRPIHAASDSTSAVCVADSRVVVYPTVSQARALWIKGKNFTISNLIQDAHHAQLWDDGAVASFRLSPQDYHRYHSPVSGTVTWFKQIPGEYYQVDPVCLQSDVDILTENARCCVIIDSEEFGKALFVAIGATNVGTVEIHGHIREGNVRIEKGEEIGLFQFGGSSIIVAFEKGRIEFDEDLLSVSRRQVMMAVEVGMSMGRAKGSGQRNI